MRSRHTHIAAMRTTIGILCLMSAACGGATPQRAPHVSDAAPEPANATPAVDLACGPFHLADLHDAEHRLLDDRVRVMFTGKPSQVGDATSGKLEIERAGATLFIGARETFTRGDEAFEKKAAETARFGGGYEPVTIAGRDVTIVAGVLRERPDDEMVALAHGWFLDADRHVVDVAVFASLGPDWDLAACGSFAQALLATAAAGKRALTYGGDGESSTTVSYATFRYQLGSDWRVGDSMGIHDFARITFRKHGVFPKHGASLELGLDSHPGDWASPGSERTRQNGKLLDIPVSWHLTQDDESDLYGAWTVSTTTHNHDHAVASLFAGTPDDRDAAIRFAESVRLGP